MIRVDRHDSRLPGNAHFTQFNLLTFVSLVTSGPINKLLLLLLLLLSIFHGLHC